MGLSIATRTVTDIKLAQQTELSSRAFNAAEAGIESVLSGQSPIGSVTVGLGGNTSTYNVTVQTVGGSSGQAFVFNKAIGKDDTQQIWFIGHNTDNSLNLNDPKNFNASSLWVFWGNTGQPAGNTSPPITPALEATAIYKDASGFKLARAVYDPNASRAASNNFISSGIESGGGYTNSKIQFRRQIDLSTSPFSISGIGTTSTLYALRLRLLYNDSPQLLGAQPYGVNDTFPVQGRLISSTGSSGDVFRKVEVLESFPALPPIFDYVLFNGSSNSLSK
ncbi:hypothetical protein HY030_01025 [Candidatus Gottesmanbacteria bacterium]|nr:hypothetical protein [Candidatus Gottesmanbacteria bacterium]